MTQHKNDQFPDFEPSSERTIPTELIVDAEIPPLIGMTVDVTKDLSAALGEDSFYVDSSGNRSPIVLDSTIVRPGKDPVPLAVFRKDVIGGADDGKRQLLIIQGSGRTGYKEDIIDPGYRYSFEKLGVEITADEDGDWVNITTSGKSRGVVTGNVPKRRAFNDQHGPLVK